MSTVKERETVASDFGNTLLVKEGGIFMEHKLKVSARQKSCVVGSCEVILAAVYPFL